MDAFTPTCFTSHSNDGLTQLGLTANTGITSIIVNRGSRPTRIHQAYILRRTWFSYYSGSSWSYQEAYTTGNTTKASDGTLKAASPVARIVASQEACQRADIAEDVFSWCGCGTANAEAEGITISRLEVGVYVLAGSAGLASEGWQLLPPMDPGGMGELGVVEAEQAENGGLTIRLFKRKYMLSDDGEMIKTKGELMDVPANSWIDVRLDMPADSLFNQRMSQEQEV
ncbi:phage tail protein [Enterobacter cloacae]|nr:phage tail protein [Enterobacter cloacae]MDH0437517.1 phage tail protein [Enterobacter cloacae]